MKEPKETPFKQVFSKEVFKKNKERLVQIQRLEEELSKLPASHPENEYLLHQTKEIFLTKAEASAVLTKEIKELVLRESVKCEGHARMNEDILAMIERLICKRLKDTKVKVDIYGSQSSGLCLATSDLDVVITCPYSPFEFLELIESYQVFSVRVG